MVTTILQTLALLLSLESAIFLVKGSIGLSAQSIAELSGTYYGYNPHLYQSLSRQTVDTRIGALLIIVAFAVQVITLWNGPTWDDLSPANRIGLLYGLLIGVFIFVVSYWSSSYFVKKTLADVECILKVRAGE